MKDYLILDTETTGIGKRDEIIELGIVDMNGNTVYHSLFNPSCPIGAKAMKVHGITPSEVKGAPRFSDEWSKIKGILNGKMILIYNANFDLRMLNQTARIYRCSEVLNQKDVYCIMRGYARYHGEWNPRTGDFRWVKLEQALHNEDVSITQNHRAIGDCLMTLALVDKIGKVWEEIL